ncbi:MAG: ribonuclease D [Gammaproteobacteria bacterium]|nr:ribonuclease D [Gammaproteobacteria bacterium]
MNTSTDAMYVDTAAALAALAARLRGAEWIAFDTEFIRDETYYPELCLLQVATPAVCACVDVIALPALGAIGELLLDPRVLKVLHAGRQDLEVLLQRLGAVPAPVFDTQIAAPLLGYPEQVSYADLVRRVLGAHVDKGQSRADWRRRPLTPAQIRYAEDDVRHLAALYPRIRAELVARGRDTWLEAELAALADPALYATAPEDAWERVKGARNLRGAELAALVGLAAWRERTAMAENRPRGWILRDDTLVDLARQRPTTAAEIARLRSVPERVARRHGEALAALIAQAAGTRPPPSAERAVPVRLDAGGEALVDVLMAAVRLRAASAELHPSVLASRGQLEALVADPDGRHPLLRGWRRELVGRELAAIVAGTASVRYGHGRFEIDVHGD